MRRTLDLGDRWEMSQVEQRPWPRASDLETASEWLPSTVPGNVVSDLVHLERLPDPFHGRAVETCRWVDHVDWWYRHRLPAANLEPDGRAFLIFYGVDYLSSTWLDGRSLGHHQGMFSRQIYEVTSFLRSDDEPMLAVRLWGGDALPRLRLSWLETLWAWIASLLQGGISAYPDRLATVKAQMSFGWDFCAAVPTVGIWDEVALVITGPVFLRDVGVVTTSERGLWRVALRLVLDAQGERPVKVAATLMGQGFDDRRSFSVELSLTGGIQQKTWEFDVKEPRLWHPWDRGESHRYLLRVEILEGERVLDAVEEPLGFRQVEMWHGPGEKWGLAINGERIFVRGVNWVPPDILAGRVNSRHYDLLIGMARSANVNLLRVWGGGFREKRAFYEACDREGILVWQELPFACVFLGRFPRDAEFLGLARRESAEIVRQLRNHPSVALWCGGNEYSARRNAPLAQALREAVMGEDETRPYRAASPGPGDGHNWWVWHSKANIADYRADGSPFLSEFGLQALPSEASLERFLDGRDRFPPGEAWCHHGAELDKLVRYVRPFAPQTLREWVAATQRAQAQGIQVAVEHMRRRKGETSGVVVWQFNEPWPAISWSLVGYDRRPKLGYHRLRQLYHPALVSLDLPERAWMPGDPLEACVWVINDGPEELKGCRVRVVLGSRVIFHQELDIPPDSSFEVGHLGDWVRVGENFLQAELWQGGERLTFNTYDLTYSDRQEAGLWAELRYRLGHWAKDFDNHLFTRRKR